MHGNQLTAEKRSKLGDRLRPDLVGVARLAMDDSNVFERDPRHLQRNTNRGLLPSAAAPVSAVVFFAPEAGGYFLEYNNFIPADPMVTPAHIAPVWYFTPFYSMLRAITAEMMYALVACVVLAAAFGVFKARMPVLFKGIVAVAAAVVVALMLAIDAKFWGVVVMGGAVIILFFLPWLDNSPVKSIRYRPSWHKYVYAVFVVNFVILAYLGVQPPSPVGERVSQVGTLLYFGFFLLMPWWSAKGETKPVPDRVTYKAH